jgi:hypothetical protein
MTHTIPPSTVAVAVESKCPETRQGDEKRRYDDKIIRCMSEEAGIASRRGRNSND